MSFYIKPKVNLTGLSVEALLALIVAGEVYEQHGMVCRLTCAVEPNHQLHTPGKAIDLGIKDLNGEVYPDTIIDSILDSLRMRLGKQYGGQYDVVDERSTKSADGIPQPHIHIEHDPR